MALTVLILLGLLWNWLEPETLSLGVDVWEIGRVTPQIRYKEWVLLELLGGEELAVPVPRIFQVFAVELWVVWWRTSCGGWAWAFGFRRCVVLV